MTCPVCEDPALLAFVLERLPELRDELVFKAYHPRLVELRSLVLRTHGNEGMDEWRELISELHALNSFTAMVANVENRQLARLVRNAREKK